jgi:hypothetical protein
VKALVLLAVVLSLLLTGCGGGYGSGKTSPGTTNQQQNSGGYGY